MRQRGYRGLATHIPIRKSVRREGRSGRPRLNQHPTRAVRNGGSRRSCPRTESAATRLAAPIANQANEYEAVVTRTPIIESPTTPPPKYAPWTTPEAGATASQYRLVTPCTSSGIHDQPGTKTKISRATNAPGIPDANRTKPHRRRPPSSSRPRGTGPIPAGRLSEHTSDGTGSIHRHRRQRRTRWTRCPGRQWERRSPRRPWRRPMPRCRPGPRSSSPPEGRNDTFSRAAAGTERVRCDCAPRSHSTISAATRPPMPRADRHPISLSSTGAVAPATISAVTGLALAAANASARRWTRTPDMITTFTAGVAKAGASPTTASASTKPAPECAAQVKTRPRANAPRPAARSALTAPIGLRVRPSETRQRTPPADSRRTRTRGQLRRGADRMFSPIALTRSWAECAWCSGRSRPLCVCYECSPATLPIPECRPCCPRSGFLLAPVRGFRPLRPTRRPFHDGEADPHTGSASPGPAGGAGASEPRRRDAPR